MKSLNLILILCLKLCSLKDINSFLCEQNMVTTAALNSFVSLVIYNFNDINKVKCNFNATNSVSFIPSKPLIFNFDNYTIYMASFPTCIILSNYKGISFISSQIADLSNFFINYSILKYYYNNLELKDCKLISKIYSEKPIITPKQFVFSTGTFYSDFYCIELFKNQNFNGISYSDLSNTFIRKNYFIFLKDNDTDKYNINSSIISFAFESYNIFLGKELMNEVLFSNSYIIAIKGVILDIDKNTFGNFKSNYIYFEILNLRSLLYKSKFLTNLAYHVRNSTILLIHSSYDFPNEDMCLIKDILLRK